MLEKVRQINVNTSTGAVHFDDKITFMDGDKDVATIQLRGELPKDVKVAIRVKQPSGDIVDVEGKVCPYKGISHEFLLKNTGVGIYECQLIFQSIYKVNKSQIWQYEVLKSL